jgi:hypothetical protein
MTPFVEEFAAGLVIVIAILIGAAVLVNGDAIMAAFAAWAMS